MLTEPEFKSFFQAKAVSLPSIIPLNSFDPILQSASDHSRSFALFLLEIFKIDKTGKIATLKGDSWSQLYDFYISFMVGYTGNKC